MNGPNPNANTITVVADGVVIDGLTVTGGRNGISGVGASRLTIRNCTVQNVGANGVVFFQGAAGTVDNCIVENNDRNGIFIEGASATVTNSTISENAGAGITLIDGGGGRLGISNLTQFAGNTISNNGASGILVTTGATAVIGGNLVIGNGTDPAAGPLRRFGIHVFQAKATIVGNNTIAGNAGSGVQVSSSSVLIGDPGPGLSTANTISANGASAFPNGGIFAERGASLGIQNATITGNTGNGVTLNFRSNANMFGDSLTDNTGDGIRLELGSGLTLGSPAVTVTGNGGFGLQCTDGESSFAGNTAGIGANTAGVISPTCAGF